METRDSYYKDLLDFELSPKENNLFYFPCGSISSFHESMEISEESKEIDWNSARKSRETEEKNSLILENLNYIAYEQMPIERSGLINSQASFKNSLYRKTSQDAETNTELTYNDIKELQSQAEQSFLTMEDLAIQLKMKQKACSELEKSLKLVKSELISSKDRIKSFEVEFLKLKLIIEDISDEDGTSRTSRPSSGETSFELIKLRLEGIKQKLNKGQKFKYSPPQEGCYEISYKRSAIASPIEGKIQNLSRIKNREQDEEIHTERPKSTLGFEYDGTERITYKEVLRDLREITNRASKALKNSSLNRRTQTNSGYFTRREDNERLKLDQKLDRPKVCKNY